MTMKSTTIKRSPLKRKPMKRSGGLRRKASEKPVETSLTVSDDLLMELAAAAILIPTILSPTTVEDARKPIWRRLMRSHRIPSTNLHVCDRCGGAFDRLEMHEIVQRRHTKPGSVARLVSYQPELVSCLCRACHDIAH